MSATTVRSTRPSSPRWPAICRTNSCPPWSPPSSTRPSSGYALIEQAAALGDAAQAGAEGHALKGSAATFGARQLREIAFAVEEAGRAGSLDAVRAQLDALRSQGSLAIDCAGSALLRRR
jgi:HPt (histidine-containing phosphotransfer) domain-containing protein